MRREASLLGRSVKQFRSVAIPAAPAGTLVGKRNSDELPRVSGRPAQLIRHDSRLNAAVLHVIANPVSLLLLPSVGRVGEQGDLLAMLRDMAHHAIRVRALALAVAPRLDIDDDAPLSAILYPAETPCEV